MVLKKVQCLVIALSWFLVCVVSQDALSSSTAIPLESDVQCTNTSEFSDVCVTVSDSPSSTEITSSDTTTVLYEENNSISSSTKESTITEATVSVSVNNVTEEIEKNNNNISATTSATPVNVSNSETTTKPVELPSTQPPTGKAVGTEQESFGPYDDICSCDITFGMCDIRCCCDPDCSDSDRLVFSSCHQKPVQTVNPRYCYQTQFVYRNNTEYKTVLTKGGLFCIVKDNIHRVDENEEKDSLAAFKDLNKLASRKRFYSWKKTSFLVPEFVDTGSHKAEEVVWKLKNLTVSAFDIPAKVAGGACQAMKAVRYLQDTESECGRGAPDSESCLTNVAFDADSYYKHSLLFGVRNTTNVKLGKLSKKNRFNSSYIPMTPFLCSHADASRRNWGKCEQLANVPRPTVDTSQDVCKNVVQTVRYLIRHNGTQGITEVYVYFTIRDMPMTVSPTEQFAQKFAVEFLWASIKTRLPKRSGRPGYIVGKPLISGLKVIHTSKTENITGKEAIQLSYDTNNWLGVPQATPNGMCTHTQRHNVLFGENSRSSCILSLAMSEFSSTSKCGEVQKKILKLLVGEAIENVTEAKQFNLHVATFGDSAIENPGDWVKVMLDSVPGVSVIVSSVKTDKKQLVCKNIVTSMHYDVVFAKIGPEVNPQAKVLAVAIRFGIPQDLSFNCNPVECATLRNNSQKNYRISSSVLFVDVTKPAVPHFLEPPVYEVKLPRDFFYPFFSGTSALDANIWLSVTLVAFYIFIS